MRWRTTERSPLCRPRGSPCAEKLAVAGFCYGQFCGTRLLCIEAQFFKWIAVNGLLEWRSAPAQPCDCSVPSAQQCKAED